jgi:hypothetical protein
MGSNAPPALVWLRYSAFLLLYPVGMASEVALLFLTLTEARDAVAREDKFCLRMPGKGASWRILNFYYFVSGGELRRAKEKKDVGCGRSRFESCQVYVLAMHSYRLLTQFMPLFHQIPHLILSGQ